MTKIYDQDVDDTSEQEGEWFIPPSSDEPVYIGGFVKLPPIYSVSTGGSSATPAKCGEIIIKGTDIAVKGGSSISETAFGGNTSGSAWFEPSGGEPELF